MRIPYGFHLTESGGLEINETQAETIRLIFHYYLAGASLGKVVDMLYTKEIPSPTGKVKWNRAAVDHLLSNSKYIAIIGLEQFIDVQFEKTPAVISTTLKMGCRGKKHATSHLLHFKCNNKNSQSA